MIALVISLVMVFLLLPFPWFPWFPEDPSDPHAGRSSVAAVEEELVELRALGKFLLRGLDHPKVLYQVRKPHILRTAKMGAVQFPYDQEKLPACRVQRLGCTRWVMSERQGKRHNYLEHLFCS